MWSHWRSNSRLSRFTHEFNVTVESKSLWQEMHQGTDLPINYPEVLTSLHMKDGAYKNNGKWWIFKEEWENIVHVNSVVSLYVFWWKVFCFQLCHSSLHFWVSLAKFANTRSNQYSTTTIALSRGHKNLYCQQSALSSSNFFTNSFCNDPGHKRVDRLIFTTITVNLI